MSKAADIIESLDPPCVRCHKPNKPRLSGQQLPWCYDCTLDLQEMTFTGEDMLGMVLDILPPTPPDERMAVRVVMIHKVARDVLIDRKLLYKSKEELDAELRKKLGL